MFEIVSNIMVCIRIASKATKNDYDKSKKRFVKHMIRKTIAPDLYTQNPTFVLHITLRVYALSDKLIQKYLCRTKQIDTTPPKG